MSTLPRNELVLKIEHHRQMAEALEEDASTSTEHILSQADRELVHAKVNEATMTESLRKASDYHQQMYHHYKKEFQARFPDEDCEEVYLEREDWMVDEIWSKAEPLGDPNLVAKEDNDKNVHPVPNGLKR